MAINSLYYLTRDEHLAEIIKICNVDIKCVKTQILRRKKKLSAEPEMPETQQAEPPAEQPIVDKEQKENTFKLPFITNTERNIFQTVDQKLIMGDQQYNSRASTTKDVIVRDRCG